MELAGARIHEQGPAQAGAGFVRAGEARQLLGDLSEDRFYDLVNRGVIPSLKVGARRRVFPVAFFTALAQYVAQHPGICLAEVDPRAVMAEAAA